MRTREQLEVSAKLRRLARWLQEGDSEDIDTEFGAADILDALRELEALRDENVRLKQEIKNHENNREVRA